MARTNSRISHCCLYSIKDFKSVAFHFIFCFVASFAYGIWHMAYEAARDQELDVSDSIIDAALPQEDVEGQKFMRRQLQEALKTVKQ